MTRDDLASAMAATLQDQRLSRAERSSLLDLFATVDGSMSRQELRRLALEVARSALAEPADAAVVDWIEGVLRLLDRLDPAAAAPPIAEAYFSPGDACWSRIVQLLASARQQVDICVFTITDDRITQAIIDAQRRGIALRVITDDEKSTDEGSDIEWLRQESVPLRVDHSRYHMHHKFAVIDGDLLLTGSYNWTRGAARNNDENFIITGDPRLVGAFGRLFERLWDRLSGS